MTRAIVFFLIGFIFSSSYAFEPAPSLPNYPAPVTYSPTWEEDRPTQEAIPKKLTAVPPPLTKSISENSQRPLGPLEMLTGKLPKPSKPLGTPPPLKPIAPITRQQPINVTINKGKVTTQTRDTTKHTFAQRPSASKRPVVATHRERQKKVSQKSTKSYQAVPTQQKPTVKIARGTKTLVSQTISEKTLMTSRMIPPNLNMGTQPSSQAPIPSLKPVVTFEIGN